MDCPPGFRQFWPIVQRFGPGRYISGGLTVKCCLPERHANGDRTPSMRLSIGNNGSLMAKCLGCGAGLKEIAERIGFPMKSFKSGGCEMEQQHGPKPKAVAEYLYHEADGSIGAKKVRFEPGFYGERKTFVWERPVDKEAHPIAGVEPKQQVWAKGLDAGNYRIHKRLESKVILELCRNGETDGVVQLHKYVPGLYRLPHIVQTSKRKIIVVEGEKDADNLAALGFLTTSGPAGMGKWDNHWGRWFKSRDVIVCGDVTAANVVNSYPAFVAASAMIHGAASVRNVPLHYEDTDGQGDITGYISRCRKAGLKDDAIKQAIIDIFAAAEVYTASSRAA